MNILRVYPEVADIFRSFDPALEIVGKAEAVSMTVCGHHFRKLLRSPGSLSNGEEGPLR